MADDIPWPRYITPSIDHLYVLGVISLNFNLYEYSMIVFLEEYFSKDVAAYLTDKLNNEERCELIRRMVKDDKRADQSLYDEVEFILRHFSTCAENRHTLLHSRPAMPSLATFGHGDVLLELEKFKRGEPDKLLTFKLEIGDLRRTADEMRAGFDFMIDLWRYFFDRDHYYTVYERVQAEGVISPEFLEKNLKPPSLPKRPPAPRKISPSPLYEVG